MLIENLLVYCRPAYEDSEGRKILHAFPLPKESEQYSAQSWSGWDKGDGKAMLIEFTEEDKKFPEFSGLELYALDKRYNGGRAYQVLFPISSFNNTHWLRCDLREDTLMDAILLEGVDKGGKLNGRYAFVREGAQTKLVLVGSDTHKKHSLRADKKKAQRKIKVSDLKVGYAYETENTSKRIYLGAYFHLEKQSFDGLIKYGSPKKCHLFMAVESYYRNSGRFETKRSVGFTSESPTRIFPESKCEEFAQEYVSDCINEMKACVQDIEKCYLKWYEHHIKNNGNRYYYDSYANEKRAKEDVARLKDKAFELYSNSVINKDKSAVVMDKGYLKALCDEALRKGLESIKEYDFLMEEKQIWLSE